MTLSGVTGHLGVTDLLIKFMKKIVTVSTYFHIFPWELYMRHQYMWVKGHLRVIDLLAEVLVMYIFSWDVDIMILG